jgi:glucokinase
MEKKLILALDFGNTKLAASTIFEGDKQWEKYERVEMDSCTGGEDHLNQMLKLADRILDGRLPDAIGVSFGGPVDFKTGKTLLSHTYKGWEDFPLKEFLEKKYGSKVAVENDANIAALGEYAFGAGRESSSMMFITVSTGVGGGLVLNGEVWQGFQGLAGEIGHMMIDPHGPRWWGRRGCIYRLSSGTFIARRARRWVQDEPLQGGVLKEMCDNDPYKITSKMVAEAADHGDKLAKEALDVSARALGLGIANTANILNLELFVIGGSVIKAGSRFWSEIVRVANESKMPEIEFKMKRAELGDEAPLWGAMELAVREINKP